MKMLQSTCLATLAVVAVGAVTGCRGWESDKAPVHLNWNMDTQEKGKSYRKSELFADGRDMRTPPAGTVAQGFLHDDDLRSLGMVLSTAEGAKPGAMKIANAFPVGDVDVARGKDRFGIYCSPCHGLSGDGDGIVNARLGVKAPSFHDARLKEMAAGQMYRAILLGANGGNMGSYAGQLTEQDRWNVLAYVRALQKARDPSVTLGGNPIIELPPDDGIPSEAKGKALYAVKGCNACHSVDGSKGVGPTWLALSGRLEKVGGADITVDDVYLTESIRMPMAKIVDGYPPAMPPNDLTDSDIKSVILFIKTLK